jgi:multidrug resistance efflux pump
LDCLDHADCFVTTACEGVSSAPINIAYFYLGFPYDFAPEKTLDLIMEWLSSTAERLVRSRSARLFLAMALIGVSAWAFFPHVAYRIAPTAFVNAELVRVAAPMAGRLSKDLPRKGDIIERTITVNLTETLSPDRRHFFDLEQQSTIAKDRADLAKRQLAEVAKLDNELETRTNLYRSGMIERIGQEITEAEAEKLGCLAEVNQRRDVGSRMEQLVKSGYASPIRTAEAFATQEANVTRCEMANAKIERFKIEQNSARTGVFLRDGANDVPYSQQQRDRLVLRRQELETEMVQQLSRQAQIAAEAIEERNRLDQTGHSDLLLHADHVVWSVSASPGSTVTEGQSILDLADCAHRFVVVDLPEREFERIKAGDTAAVRLIGSDDWKQGKIRQVLGSAARTDDRLLAAQITRPVSSSIAVEVELLQDESEAERNSFCNIGRMAEVRFQRTGLGFADGLFNALAGMTFRDGRHVELNSATAK